MEAPWLRSRANFSRVAVPLRLIRTSSTSPRLARQAIGPPAVSTACTKGVLAGTLMRPAPLTSPITLISICSGARVVLESSIISGTGSVAASIRIVSPSNRRGFCCWSPSKIRANKLRRVRLYAPASPGKRRCNITLRRSARAVMPPALAIASTRVGKPALVTETSPRDSLPAGESV